MPPTRVVPQHALYRSTANRPVRRLPARPAIAHNEEPIVNSSAVSELQGVARFKFDLGELEEFKRLSAQCMDIVRTKDTGTLQYGIYFNADQSECIVLERYRDSQALIEHASHLGALGEAILRAGWTSGELLGEPSAEVAAKLMGSAIRVF